MILVYNKRLYTGFITNQEPHIDHSYTGNVSSTLAALGLQNIQEIRFLRNC